MHDIYLPSPTMDRTLAAVLQHRETVEEPLVAVLVLVGQHQRDDAAHGDREARGSEGRRALVIGRRRDGFCASDVAVGLAVGWI